MAFVSHQENHSMVCYPTVLKKDCLNFNFSHQNLFSGLVVKAYQTDKLFIDYFWILYGKLASATSRTSTFYILQRHNKTYFVLAWDVFTTYGNIYELVYLPLPKIRIGASQVLSGPSYETKKNMVLRCNVRLIEQYFRPHIALKSGLLYLLSSSIFMCVSPKL